MGAVASASWLGSIDCTWSAIVRASTIGGASGEQDLLNSVEMHNTDESAQGRVEQV